MKFVLRLLRLIVFLVFTFQPYSRALVDFQSRGCCCDNHTPVMIDDETSSHGRRTHVALTAIFVVSVILIELASYVRSLHLALLFLSNLGFVYAVAIFMIIIILHCGETDGVFHVPPWSARALVWLSVVTVGTLIFNALRVGIVLGGHTSVISPGVVAIEESLNSTMVEAIVAHHLYHNEKSALVIVLVFVILLGLLHLGVIAYYARGLWEATGLAVKTQKPSPAIVIPFSANSAAPEISSHAIETRHPVPYFSDTANDHSTAPVSHTSFIPFRGSQNTDVAPTRSALKSRMQTSDVVNSRGVIQHGRSFGSYM